jgi:aminoglycoside phosphotransferase (APT) family kinase protein
LSPVEIVDTPAEAGALELAPLLVRRPVEAWLDLHSLGSGPVAATRLGEGNSNVTYLLERGGERFVLRRPPRPPLPPSAHDMLREARVQIELERAGARVPHLLAVCDDESVLGVPFYVMEYLEGAVVTSAVPSALDSGAEHRRIGLELVDALAEIHAVDWASFGLEDFGKPTGYLERQIRRFAGLWEVNATRDLPEVAALAVWLDGQRPESREAAVVHGDYRLGNVMLARERPARVIAVLDWELSTIGDPLADLGYLIATYTDSGSPGTPLELSPVTGQGGFPDRTELAERYEERSGRSVSALAWYETLALWKAAVFCEAIYGRWLKGELAADHRFASSLEAGVPRLLEVAAETAARA